MKVRFSKGGVQALRLREATIGASDDCTLQVDGDEVAGRHARIEQISGRFVIRDLGSVGGTFVGTDRVGPEPHALAPGQVVKVGNIEFRVVAIDGGMVEIDPQDEFVLRREDSLGIAVAAQHRYHGAERGTLSEQELRTYERVASALEDLDSAPRGPSSTEHLSVLALGEWAAGERPPTYLAAMLEEKAPHVSTCGACKAAVEYFRERARRTSNQ